MLSRQTLFEYVSTLESPFAFYIFIWSHMDSCNTSLMILNSAMLVDEISENLTSLIWEQLKSSYYKSCQDLIHRCHCLVLNLHVIAGYLA
jgi:hypothetical protein